MSGHVGAERNGYHAWWWFFTNDNRKRVGRQEIYGSILKYGRFRLYRYGFSLLSASWRFGSQLSGLDLVLRLDTDDGATVHFSVFGLVSLWLTLGLKRRWLEPWMLDDREFGVRLGYIGDIAWIQIAHAEWGTSTGMLDYYQREKPPRYTPLQLWPGWEIKLRWPRVDRWLFGMEKRDKVVVSQESVAFEMDGRKYHGLISWEQWETRRPRWPWAYSRSQTAWIEVNDPPRFAGKGENSWDCDDDGIYGTGSRERTAAGVVGDYIKRVLQNRERYGMPRAVASGETEKERKRA